MPVVNYREAILRAGLLEPVVFPQEFQHARDTHPHPLATAASPTTGWSWVDRRFVHEHAAHLSRDAVLLYFVLCAVADKHGLSFYGDATMAAMVRMNLPALMAARDELLARDLIAHEKPRFTQVLSLPPAGRRRRGEPGGGPMQLGEILRRAAGLPQPHDERSLP